MINSALTYLLNTTGNASLGFNVQGLDLLNEGFLILALQTQEEMESGVHARSKYQKLCS